MDVADFERHVPGTAIGAFPACVTLECSLLICDAGNVSVLHGLDVEEHQFLRQRRNRRHTPQLIDPCRRRIDPVPLGECPGPVLQLEKHKHRGLADDLAGRAVPRFRFPYQGHARGLADGVQFQAQKPQAGICLHPIHQPDSERHPKVGAHPFRRVLNQRCLSLVQNPYSRISSLVLATQAAACIPPRDCLHPAPTCDGSGWNLRRFAFRQHDSDPAEAAN